MTNEQLSILLDKYADLLAAEVVRMEDEIKDIPDFWRNATDLQGNYRMVCWLTANLATMVEQMRDEVEMLRGKNTY